MMTTSKRKKRLQRRRLLPKLSRTALKEFFVHLGIGGNVSSLIRFVILTKWMKITDDPSAEAVNEKSSGIGASWVVLTALDCLLPEGFDASEVESGFFAPTNKDNHVGPPKKEYLTGEGEAIKRPEFGPKPKKDKKTDHPSVPPHPKDNGGYHLNMPRANYQRSSQTSIQRICLTCSFHQSPFKRGR
jgi:hypothetical protein